MVGVEKVLAAGIPLGRWYGAKFAEWICWCIGVPVTVDIEFLYPELDVPRGGSFSSSELAAIFSTIDGSEALELISAKSRAAITTGVER